MVTGTKNRSPTEVLSREIRTVAGKAISPVTLPCTGWQVDDSVTTGPTVAARLARRLDARGVHYGWVVAAVSFLTLITAAGFRSTVGVLIVPLQDEFGWSRATLSLAVGVNLVLFGLTAPFAAALMDRFGIRRVTTAALLLISAGSGLTVFVAASWQLVLTWGVLIGLGTGSMALVFAANDKPLTYALREQMRAFSSNIDVIGPGAFVSMIIPLAVFFAFQRYFVQGLLAGSVK